MNFYHKSVLLQQVIEMLNVQKDELYIDATLGGGGHTKDMLSAGGKVLGIDQDQDAISHVEETLQEEIQTGKLKLVQGNFKDLEKIATENGFGQVSGVLFDLGVSSYQLDEKDRGFSIKHDGPLDMRMDTRSERTAQEIVQKYSKEDLADIFMRYGEEDSAEDIAQAIVEARQTQEIKTTHELVKIIETVVRRTGKMHPATRVFQALRIEVNMELDAIKDGIRGAFSVTKKNGRIAVISFHSLEDRIIKRMFDEAQQKGLGQTIHKKPIIADETETTSNPRARSAKLRVFEIL